MKCDICGQDNLKQSVDGATQWGPWAIMCLPCHMRNGHGLGVGQGQMYEMQDGKRVQIAGGTQKGKVF